MEDSDVVEGLKKDLMETLILNEAASHMLHSILRHIITDKEMKEIVRK